MNAFIDQLMREYFCQCCQPPEANGKFVKFESEDQPNRPIGAHSTSVSGRIWYTTEDQQVHKSARLFVKCLSAEEQKLWPGAIFWFRAEIHFYAKVAPFLDSLRSIRQLIPHFLHAKEDAGTVALVFDHLELLEFANAREGGLDYAHLSLMARKLGEFHAYTFLAAELATGQLQEVAALSVDNYASLATAQEARTVQILRRALQPLGRDARLAAAVPRVERMLANFVESVTGAFGNSSKAGFVLCHRSYSRSNVMFRYAGGAPVDLVIVDWQTMAFASLGVDLGLVLYLEAGQSVRDQHWHRLLNDYRESLGKTFGESVGQTWGSGVSLPSEEDILEGLRISAAATLNMLAYKVHQSHIKSDQDVDGTRFNDHVISEVLADMVRRNLL